MGKCSDCVARLFRACGNDSDCCQQERETLLAEARLLAEERGHLLGEFAHVEGWSIWEAHCTQCDEPAFIDLDPAVGHPSVYGGATTTRCPAAEELGPSENIAERDSTAEDDVAPWDRVLPTKAGKR